MKLATFTALLLVGLAHSAPTSKEDKLVVTDSFFIDSLKIYEGKHDIVKVYIPLNSINFDDSDDSSSSENDEDSNDPTLFFVEADVNDGVVTDQGLYVRKSGTVKKLLDNGRDADAPHDASKLAYFAAKEGLYVYNFEKNEAEKYGTVDDDLKAIACSNNSNLIFVLATDKTVSKVTDAGTKKTKIDDINNAEQIVLDLSNNLYYVDSEKKVFVATPDGVKRFEGLPENPTKITLVRPPFVLDDGVPIIVDNKAYSVYANGSVDTEPLEINVPITAYSMEATLVQYYAYDKKIYEYNILAIILGDLLEEFKGFLDDMKNEIESIATRSRSEFVNN